MIQRNQMGIRFIQIPADKSQAIIERISKIDNTRLSCDAAYFIPALLRDGPAGFNAASNWHTILPFPTFNECLKDNVPLFFFKRSEGRDKQENVRAKQLLDLFADKLCKRQNTFYGDVLVFWRRNVDEIRHQMKLADFALSDASRLVGASCALGIAASPSASLTSPAPTSPADSSNSNLGLQNDNRTIEKSSPLITAAVPIPGLSSAVATNDNSELSPECRFSEHKMPSFQSDTMRKISKNEDEQGSREVTVSDVLQANLEFVFDSQQDMHQQSPSSSPCSPVQISQKSRTGTFVSTEELEQQDDLKSLHMQQQQHILKLIDGASDTALEDTVRQSLNSLHLNNNGLSLCDIESTSPSIVVKNFLQSLSRQLPAVSAAFDELTSTSSHNNLKQNFFRNRWFDTQSDEQRSTVAATLKLTADLSQASELNTRLMRENEVCRRELLAAQSQGRLYMEEARQLAGEITVLREETLQLRKTVTLLEDELALSGNRVEQMSARLMSLRTLGTDSHSPDSASSSPKTASKRSLHHVKGSLVQDRSPTSDSHQQSSSVKPTQFSSPISNTTPGTLGVSNSVPQISSLTSGLQSSANIRRGGVDGDVGSLPGRTTSSVFSSYCGNNNGEFNNRQSSNINSSSQIRTYSQGRNIGISKGLKPITDQSDSVQPSLAGPDITGRRCIVTQIYKPSSNQGSNDQFAQLKEGDVVTVEREDPTGWWWVTNGTAIGSGWYPYSFLQQTELLS